VLAQLVALLWAAAGLTVYAAQGRF